MREDERKGGRCRPLSRGCYEVGVGHCEGCATFVFVQMVNKVNVLTGSMRSIPTFVARRDCSGSVLAGERRAHICDNPRPTFNTIKTTSLAGRFDLVETTRLELVTSTMST